jgi:hypothetical protein
MILLLARFFLKNEFSTTFLLDNLCLPDLMLTHFLSASALSCVLYFLSVEALPSQACCCMNEGTVDFFD